MSGTHEFALYAGDLLEHINHKPGSHFALTDSDLYHRIKQVLRLKEQEVCVLFNRHAHARVRIKAIDKKKIDLELQTWEPNKQLTPHITMLIPILKRDALAEAVYNATELGANSIQLVTTAKMHRAWDGEKELQRLERVVVAAAEQAKHFALPELAAPVNLEIALKQLTPNTLRIFCDPAGQPFLPLLNEFANQATPLNPSTCTGKLLPASGLALRMSGGNIALLIGPEGDLVETEKVLLSQHQFVFCALTPTILRAPQAVSVALGLLRSTLE